MDRRILALTGLAVVIGAGGCVHTNPLSPFEELKTGGRTALSHWEYREAIAKLYEAQVFLNLIRIIEYGEAPVHFRFSEFTTTIDDTGVAKLGLEFLDAPEGSVTIAGIEIPSADTSITFKPEASATRNVRISAKAEPLTNRNWVFEWYYTIAAQQLQNEDYRWYHREPAETRECRPPDDSRSLPALYYRGHTYRLQPCFSEGVLPDGLFDVDSLASAAGTITPRMELGSLTAILSFLSPSRPSFPQADPTLRVQDLRYNSDYEAYVATVEVSKEHRQDLEPLLLPDPAGDGTYLDSILAEPDLMRVPAAKLPPNTREGRFVLSFLRLRAEALSGVHPVQIFVPRGAGESDLALGAMVLPPFESVGSVVDFLQFPVAVGDEHREALEAALAARQEKKAGPVRMRFGDLQLRQAAYISPTARILEIVRRPDRPPERDDVDVLEDILSVLRRTE